MSRDKKARPNIAILLAMSIGLLALLISVVSLLRPNSASNGTRLAGETALERTKRTGILRAAYGGFPPYTIVNVNEQDPNQAVSGFCVDLIQEIAARHQPPLRVEWTNLNWETMKADMESGKFDVLADAVYMTIPRASEFAFTEPFSYFGIACGVVRKDDDRFKDFRDLDREDITISVAVGWTSTEYAKRHLTKPRFKEVIVAESAFVQLDDVLHSRSDIALQDSPTVIQYVRAHPDKVKAVFLERPPSTVAAGFVTRKADRDLLQFLSTSIRALKVDGTIEELDKKWNALGFYEKLNLVPGKGLTQSFDTAKR